jgi:mannose-6-phosphate isomerase-like protein (cupin superfamily)
VSAGGTGARVVDTKSAEHYTWGGVCDGWHLVRSSELSVIEERMPPGAREQRHFHRQARQFFYVLAGELVMETEGALHKIESGQGLEIAPGVAHQARNESNESVRFLVMSQPPSHLDRVASDES